MKFKRITRSQAKKLWAERKTIYLCPCNMYPGGMWNVECPVVLNDDYIESALRYKADYDNQDKSYYAKQYAHLWKGTIENTAWDLMYNNWSYYNTNSEMGYYAHYYILSG